MVEKKFCVFELRQAYNGPISIGEFKEYVFQWAKDNGYEIEIKKDMDHREPHGRKVEWIVEIWKKVAEWATSVVRLRAMFDNVKDVEVHHKGMKARAQHADCFFLIDGLLITVLRWKWEQWNPVFYFFRTLWDKYILPNADPQDKFTGLVWTDTHEFFKKVKLFVQNSRSQYS